MSAVIELTESNDDVHTARTVAHIRAYSVNVVIAFITADTRVLVRVVADVV